MHSASQKLYKAWWILRLTYGSLFMIVGADKFFNLLTDWRQFIGAGIGSIPLSTIAILKLFALVQMIAGVLLFTRWIYWGIVSMLILLTLIFINLLMSSAGIVVLIHDAMMIVGVITLMNLTKIVKLTP